MRTNTCAHEHPGGENFSGRTHYKDARRCRGWYSMKHGAPGLTCFALHGCRYGILITELRHISATADYILCPLTSVRLVLTVPIEQRSSGSLTTPTPRPPPPSGGCSAGSRNATYRFREGRSANRLYVTRSQSQLMYW